VILTPRLRLRPSQRADAQPLAAILAEPAVARFWPGYHAARVDAELVEPEGATVLVAERTDGEVVGAVLHDWPEDPEYPHVEIDVFLATRCHGQGLGAEILGALVDDLFDAHGVPRVTADPTAANARAIRAFTRVGFRAVGLMRHYHRAHDGSFHDGLLMELLAEDRPRPARPGAATASGTVRTAGEADVPFLLGCMVDFNRGEGIPWSPETGEAPLRRLLGDPTLGRAAIVSASGEPAGYAIVSRGYDLEFGGPDAFLTELYVVPSARGLGLARRLLDALLADLRAEGAGALHLQVRPDNVAAQRLYESAGFEGTTRMFLSKRLS
jgi:aminoglycoside 6'-N-acetyltransferase